MAKQTKRDKVIALIVENGAVEVESRSRKYRTFTRTKGPSGCPFWFVGRKGALRTGKCSSGSYSVSSFMKERYGI